MRQKRIILYFTTFLVLSITCLATSIPKSHAFQTGSIGDVPKTASRLSGVAPLYVQFNVPLRASNATERSFHNSEYIWDFGEKDNLNKWANTNLLKNTAKGPVVGHVYETPGTYYVTYIRGDQENEVLNRFTIEVYDPDIFYEKSLTTCVTDTSNADFTGCPTGSNLVTTDDLSTLNSYVGDNRRILLHRGSSWTISQRSILKGDSFTLGAYGACELTAPLASGATVDPRVCSNAPLITLEGDIDFISLTGREDMRVMDIAFTDTTDSGIGFTATKLQKDILLLRVMGYGIQSLVVTDVYRTGDNQAPSNFAVVDCYLDESYGPALFIGSDGLFIGGNTFYGSKKSHTVRIWNAYKSFIAHNTFSGADYTGGGLHALKLHAIEENIISQYTKNGWVVHRSNFVVISDNVFGSSGPWTVALGPQNDVYDERVSDVIFERNRVFADYGLEHTDVTLMVLFDCSYLTARNNIIDATGASKSGITAFKISHRGAEPLPRGFNIHNNTIFLRDVATAFFRGIDVSNSATDVIVQNNFALSPSVSGVQTMVVDDGNIATKSNNILSTNPELLPNAINDVVFFRDFGLPENVEDLQMIEPLKVGDSIPVFTNNSSIKPSNIGAYDVQLFQYLDLHPEPTPSK